MERSLSTSSWTDRDGVCVAPLRDVLEAVQCCLSRDGEECQNCVFNKQMDCTYILRDQLRRWGTVILEV